MLTTEDIATIREWLIDRRKRLAKMEHIKTDPYFIGKIAAIDHALAALDALEAEAEPVIVQTIDHPHLVGVVASFSDHDSNADRYYRGFNDGYDYASRLQP